MNDLLEREVSERTKMWTAIASLFNKLAELVAKEVAK